MSAPYYTGDTVPLKFAVLNSPPPTSVSVTIQKPDGGLSESYAAVIDGSEVSYNVTGSITNLPGLYKVYFVCTLPFGERTHVVEFTIIHNPI